MVSARSHLFAVKSNVTHSLFLAAVSYTHLDGGTVTYAGYNSSYGNFVMISHPSTGYVTLYAHCNQLLVYTGQKVSQGETIALVGSTGDSTGPHCHFEVRINGSTVDAMNFF